MGLLYVFPVSTEEADFVEQKDRSLVLKTYGLPYIFWFYAVCIVAVIFFMFLAIKEPVLKLVQLGDDVDSLLGHSLLTFIGLAPVLIFSFFFYEKRIISRKNELELLHRVYGITVFKEKFQLESSDELVIEPFLSSPNIARMKGNEESLGFQNKGYFILWLKGAKQKIQIDRHSRKVDLEKLRELIVKGQNL
jgi:hypothetical protein